MEDKQTQKKARNISISFVVIIGLILIGIIACIVGTPYDSGILTGASLSGNNQYGGMVTASSDYLFYVQKGHIMRQDRAGGEAPQSIYQGDVSHLNPYDGWLYFLNEGKIMRIAYYGGMETRIGTATDVQMMSVNGLWIYYLDGAGRVGKVRADGEKETLLTDERVAFTSFESANRIILATDGKNIYRMKTDGSEMETLITGTDISRMIYTLDSLFYCDNTEVLQVKSVEAGRDDGTEYGGVTAQIFTYNVNSNGRGQIFYVKDGELRVRKLESVEDDTEEDRLLTKVTDITDLYSIDADLYYHDAAGQLYYVMINDSEVTVEPVE